MMKKQAKTKIGEFDWICPKCGANNKSVFSDFRKAVKCPECKQEIYLEDLIDDEG